MNWWTNLLSIEKKKQRGKERDCFKHFGRFTAPSKSLLLWHYIPPVCGDRDNALLRECSAKWWRLFDGNVKCKKCLNIAYTETDVCILGMTYFWWLKYVLLLVWFEQYKALLPDGHLLQGVH